MFKTILVEPYVRAGRQIVDQFERAGVTITAAFWFFFEEEERWRLVIVSPDVATRGPRKLYEMIHPYVLFDLRNDPEIGVDLELEQIRLVSPESLLYKRVKHGVGLSITQGPARGGVVEDVYVYRI